MTRWLFSVLFVLLLAAGAYLALPYYAIGQLEHAAQDRSTTRLKQWVDFPVLRDNVAHRMQADLRMSMGNMLPQELDELFVAGSNLFLTPILRQLVTPDGVADVLRGGSGLRSLMDELERELGQIDPSLVPGTDGSGARTDWHRHHWQFVALDEVVAEYGGNRSVELRATLARQGMRWRLVDLEWVTAAEQSDTEESHNGNG